MLLISNSNITLNTKSLGFTLVELMIVVSILGILTMMSLPAYNTYFNRSKFIEATLETKPPKNAILIAIETQKALKGKYIALTELQSGTYGIEPKSLPTVKRHGVDVNNSIITITWRNDSSDLDGITYILKPNSNIPPIQWTIAGTCLTNGYC